MECVCMKKSGRFRIEEECLETHDMLNDMYLLVNIQSTFKDCKLICKCLIIRLLYRKCRRYAPLLYING